VPIEGSVDLIVDRAVMSILRRTGAFSETQLHRDAALEIVGGKNACLNRSVKSSAKREKRNPPAKALLIAALLPRDASQFLLKSLGRFRLGHAVVRSGLLREARNAFRCDSIRRRSRPASASPM
jgi:hypothetical protein